MLTVREETPADYAAIRALLLEAFPLPSEANLVERLRDEGDVVLALVAFDGDALVGHVMLSPMRAPFPALGLAPLTVHAGRRNQGIGAHLVAEAVERVRGGAWEAMFVVGDPEYYARFGFSAEAAAGYKCAYSGPHFMAMPLDPLGPSVTFGNVAFAPAFAIFE